MIISHSHQFILLAPWKTASQTLHASLAAYNQSPYSRTFHFNPALSRVVHQHVTLADLQAIPEGRLGYKTGAFVRNPYDRAYSGFIQLDRDFRAQPCEVFDSPWIGELVKEQISANMSRIIAAGFDFNLWFASLPDHEILESGRNTNMPLHPVHYWTHIEGCSVDFTGKVETLNEDYQRFCEFVGIDSPAIESHNVTENAAAKQSTGYRYANRMSRSTIDRINLLFARDFELFGYEKL